MGASKVSAVPAPPAAAPSSRTRRAMRLIPLWTQREVRAQYRQSALSVGWALLTPVIMLIGYGLVLTSAFDVSRGLSVPYATFAWTGLVVWTFMANGILRGTSSLVSSADLLRKTALPYEVVPISAVAAVGLDLVLGLLALVGLMIVQGTSISVQVVAVPFVLLAAFVWTAGAALVLGTVTAFVRDGVHGLAVVLRIGVFVTPVMYPMSQVPEQYRWLIDLNPFAVFIESVRQPLLYHQWPDWELLGLHTLGGVLLVVVGLAYLRRVEGRIADVI
ncbi:MAG: ABC transporter permease [Acidimicrobiales bacterium]